MGDEEGVIISESHTPDFGTEMGNREEWPWPPGSEIFLNVVVSSSLYPPSSYPESKTEVVDGNKYSVRKPKFVSSRESGKATCQGIYLTPKRPLPFVDTTSTPANCDQGCHSFGYQHQRQQVVNMSKKRRSLQSILIPSFLHTTSLPSPTTLLGHRREGSSAARASSSSVVVDHIPSISGAMYQQQQQEFASHSSSSSTTIQSTDDRPPPELDFLLDDDPFANLTCTRIISTPPTSIPFTAATSFLDAPPPPPHTLNTPRSPLSPPDSATSMTFGVTSTPPQQPTKSMSLPYRPRSSGKLRVRPAHERPAFAPRPSLPSLDTLARMMISPPRKVRRGHVGAQLPFEPWENGEEGMMMMVGYMSKSEPTTSVRSRMDWPDLVPEEEGEIEMTTAAGDDEDDDEDDCLFGFEEDGTDTEDGELSWNSLSTPSLMDHSSGSLSRSLSLASISSCDLGDVIHYQHHQSKQNHQFISTPPRSDSDLHHSPPHSFILPHSHTFSPPSPPLPISDHDHHDHDHDHHQQQQPELGSSVETIRPSVHQQIRDSAITTMRLDFSAEQSDTSGWSSHSSRSSPQHSRSAYPASSAGFDGYSQGGSNSNGRSNYPTNGYPSGGSGGYFPGGSGRGDDGGDDRRNRQGPRTTQPYSTETSSEEEEEPQMPESCSEDDVPLAQRIPNALTAQRSIRRQFREEREQRRRERAEQYKLHETSLPSLVSPNSNTPAAPAAIAPVSSSQEAAIHASQPVRTRPRTRTMPSNTPRPFTADELTRKLKDVQANVARSLVRPSSASRSTSRGGEFPRGRRMDDVPTQSQQPQSANLFSQTLSTSPNQEPSARTLRPMRSFHRSEPRRSDEALITPLPVDAAQKIGRATTMTRAKSRAREEVSTLTPPSAWQARPRVSHEEPPRSSFEQQQQQQHQQRKPSKSQPNSALVPKTSMEFKPAVSLKTQQRVFIGDMQTFNIVEIDNSTTAEEVLEMVRTQGSLSGAGTGAASWMVFEVAQDFGMERPVRGYELLSDIQASWNKDKLVNTFVIKMTPLAGLLGRSAIPTSSPTHAGWVEWESKRGKWSKRWLQLREHSLWLSKRDKGKDEVFLCSLSNFDAYFVTRACKAPKPFVFGVKSTDNLSFFENTADYMHMFSCVQKDGPAWMEKILIARSYVLYQERNVLFNPKGTITTPSSAPATTTTSSGTSLSRSGTRKAAAVPRPFLSPSQPLPSAPLISIPPPYTSSSLPATAPTVTSSYHHHHHNHSHNKLFEPGSLLYNKLRS
ncbi:hypothetical protein AMATHDRAFT_85274 [Amanita thiersii Skay4041]|uniref:PH domain-containing protein n=1 Tax=Amanita thiersii Skay4041 TaxID=703135 RepID=A0A2A9NJU7_9AGAR|nr:hypothetical protein AMATHDRAFT_85274 [Amanita thiersii Skay4041]